MAVLWGETKFERDRLKKRIAELEAERDKLKVERDEAKAFLRRMGPRGEMD
jgi:50S ribosomal subunit-associated GTPase HflX